MAMNAQKKRPTINDVALAAGVSRGTVSRVLNGGHWVSQDAARAVEAAIKSTGFRVNVQARGLATSRTGSVAFLLNESLPRLFTDPNFSTLIEGVSTALSARDMALVLLLASTPAEQARAKDYLLGGHVDGALAVSWHANAHSILQDLVQAGCPVVACGVPLGLERKIGWVAADDYAGARTMVAYLRSTGRRRIGHISGPPDTPGGVRRLQGYQDELRDEFDPSVVATGDYSYASGRRCISELLDNNPTLDAVFCANDLMARAAIDELNMRGRRVPADVAVGGFDDSAAAVSGTPHLTTMRQPFEQISDELVRRLLGRIEGEPRGTMTIDVDLIIREST